MEWKVYRGILYREGFKTLITTTAVFALISILRVNAPHIERAMNSHSYVEFLFYGLYAMAILALILVYRGLGARSWRTTYKPFVVPGDFYALSVCSGILLNYFSGMGFESMRNGRILSYLFGCTSILAIMCLILFLSTFSVPIFKFIRGLVLKLKQKRTSQNAVAETPPSPSVLRNREIDGSKEQDLLNRYPFAEHLRDYLLTERDESCTIGILGPWGSGKSSMLSMVKKLIEEKKDSRFTIIEYNPWYFGESHHEVLQRFLLQLLKEIRQRYGINAKLNREIRQYAKMLSSVTLRPDMWNLAFKDAIELLFPSDEAKSMYALKNDIESSLQSLGTNFIVFVDDLDRLDPSEIQAVLKLIRLVADFPSITYVLALDEEIAANSIQLMYASEDDGNCEQGKKYLEKFIQLPLYLPKPNPASLFSLFTIGLEEIRKNLNIGESLLFEDVLRELAALDFSPRNIKRTLFTYEFYLRVLQKDVDKADLLRLTVLKILKPELHEFIYRHKSFFTSAVKDAKALTEPFHKIADHQPFKQLLIHLAPNSMKLYPDAAGKVEIEQGKKRLADPIYFDRYFRNVLLDNEVSQQAIDDFIDSIHNHLPEVFELQIVRYETSIKPYPLIDFHLELQHKLDDLDPNTLLVIAELAANKYNNLMESKNDRLNLSSMLNSCEVIIRAAAKVVKADLLNTATFRQWNIKLWMDILLFMAKEKLGIDDNNVTELLHERMRETRLEEFLSLPRNDANDLFRSFNRISAFENMKKLMGKWITDQHSLTQALTFIHDTTVMKRLDETSYVKWFTLDLRYFPSSIILPLLRDPKMRRRLPKSLKDYMQKFSPEKGLHEDQILLSFLFCVHHSIQYAMDGIQELLNKGMDQNTEILMNETFQAIVDDLQQFSTEHEVNAVVALRDQLDMHNNQMKAVDLSQPSGS
jgi:hypothetical protein